MKINLIHSKYLAFTICLSLTLFCTAQEAFITTWKTNNPGTSNNKSITIPTQGSGYNYDIDWNNDGIYDQTGVTGSVTHNFGTVGTYTIRIKGSFPRIRFAGGGDAKKIIAIEQWGTGKWKTMKKAFQGTTNLIINATDAPNLSEVKNMSFMFANAHKLNQNINHWNTANITNMANVFNGAQLFNQPLNNWNTAAVTNMNGMFRKAKAFNQPLNNWNTYKVTKMQRMFQGALNFNQVIGSWSTGAVTNMQAMFRNATQFNQNLSNWKVEQVQNFSNMFRGATLSISNYDALLISWNNQQVKPNMTFHGGHSKYCAPEAIAAWQRLVNYFNWTITDKGQCQTLNTPNENIASPIQLTPNPVQNVLYIKSNINLKIVKIECFDLLGKRISIFSKINGSLDVSHLKNGLYFLRIHSDNMIITKKIIKR